MEASRSDSLACKILSHAPAPAAAVPNATADTRRHLLLRGDVRRSLPDVLRCRVGFMRGSLCRRHGGGKAAGLSLGEERVGTVSRKGGKAAVLCVMCVMGNTGRGGRSYLGSLRLGRED